MRQARGGDLLAVGDQAGRRLDSAGGGLLQGCRLGKGNFRDEASVLLGF